MRLLEHAETPALQQLKTDELVSMMGDSTEPENRDSEAYSNTGKHA